jgi:hypothetical protein
MGFDPQFKVVTPLDCFPDHGGNDAGGKDKKAGGDHVMCHP